MRRLKTIQEERTRIVNYRATLPWYAIMEKRNCEIILATLDYVLTYKEEIYV